MIQPSPFFYAPKARESKGGYHELQNPSAAIDLNHRSFENAQFVVSNKMGVCPQIIACEGLEGKWGTPIEGLESAIAFGGWVRVSESNASEVLFPEI